MEVTTAKHSVAPWAQDKRLRDEDSPVICIVDANGIQIAEVWPDTRDMARDEANAQLIEAAPDLLAACIAGLKEVAFDARHDPNLDKVAKQMRDAIRKATV